MFYNYIAVFLALLYSSYTDLKKREIELWVFYALFFFGIFYHIILYHEYLFYLLNYFLFILISFIIIYILWSLGIFAGGDAKIFLAISTNIQYQYFSFFGSLNNIPFLINLFITTLLVVFPYGSFLIIYKTIKKGLIKYFIKEIKYKTLNILENIIMIISSFLIIKFFHLNPIFYFIIFFAIAYFPYKFKYIFLIPIFFFALYLDFYNNLKTIINLTLLFYFIWFILQSFKLLKLGILNEKKKIEELKEGDILAKPLILEKDQLKELNYNIFDEIKKIKSISDIKKIYKNYKKIKSKIIIDNKLASGLNNAEINLIKEKYYKNEIEVKKTMPLIPPIFIAYVLLILFGDFLWILI